MNMNQVFNKLKDLQDILVQKYALEKKIEEAPRRLDSQDELLKRLKEEYFEHNEKYDVTKEKVRNIRLELDEVIKAREEGEKGMDNITSHREYEALEKQIAENTVREQDLRRELQKEEKSLADRKELLDSHEQMMLSQEAEINAGKESLGEELNGYKAELASLQKKENKITPAFDQEILFKFQRIIQRNTEGVVAVRNGVCTGCRMILPAQFANEVRKGESILFCPYCSRILFYEEASDEDQESFFKLENSGSLVDLDDEDFDEEKDEFLSEEDEELELQDNDEDEEDIDDEDEDDDVD
ncbi:MAG: nucleic acid-binding protein [Treponema sp.]|nr:nucleic acid-binding protein [Treponema sp.]